MKGFIKVILVVVSMMIVIPLASITVLNLYTKSHSWTVNELMDRLTDEGYIAYADGTGTWTVTGDATVDGSLTSGSITDSELTIDQILYAGTAGLLTDEAAFAYDAATNTLTVDNVDSPTGRGATYVIAASDALAHVKAQADYVCDGTADNVEIQAAIDALPATGGLIHLSVGTFVLNTSIVLPDKSITIEGEALEYNSVGGTRLTTAGMNVSFITNTDAAHNITVILRDFSIDGTNQTAGSGISLYNATEVRLYNLNIIDCYQYGIYSRKSGATTYGSNFFWMDKCHIYSNGVLSVGTGVYIANAMRTLLTTNEIFSNWGHNAWLDSCIYNESLGNVYEDNSNVGAQTGLKVSGCGWFTSIGDIFSVSQREGLYIEFTYYVIINGATATDNSQVLANALPGIYIVGSNPRHIKTCVITGCKSNNTESVTQKYGIDIGSYVDSLTMVGNDWSGNVTGGLTFSGTVPTKYIVEKNMGYIASGEVRTASGSLTGGAANAILFSWHNPEAQDIYIKKVVVVITTADADAANIDCGIADDATYTNGGIEFFDDLTGETILVYDSWVAGDNGKQTKWVFCQDSASATDGWVVAKILTNDGTSIVGSWYIEYVGK